MCWHLFTESFGLNSDSPYHGAPAALDRSKTSVEPKVPAAPEAQRASLGDEAAYAAIAVLRRELADLETVETETSCGKECERRVVTVLFCDVTGCTAMAVRLDPEAWPIQEDEGPQRGYAI
jgi:hypothetical protein